MIHNYFDPSDPTGMYYNPMPEGMTDRERDEYLRQSLRMAVKTIIGFVAALAVLAVMGIFTSCTTTRTVTVERVKHDTLTVTRQQRDSIFMHDSIYVNQYTQGDTVFLEVQKWHTQFRDRWHHDSIYIARRDSVPVPYPVERQVPAQLSWWQQLQMWLGRLVLIALAVCAGWWIVKKRTWWIGLLKKFV